jgi:hypothetical protein
MKKMRGLWTRSFDAMTLLEAANYVRQQTGLDESQLSAAYLDYALRAHEYEFAGVWGLDLCDAQAVVRDIIRTRRLELKT